MKSTTVLKALVAVAVVLMAVSAYAASSITLLQPATVNGKQLSPGEYNLKVSGSGANAEITFYKGKTAVASAKGKFEERPTTSRYDGVVGSQNSDGTQTIKEVQFRDKKQVLVLEGGDAMASSENSAGKQ